MVAAKRDIHGMGSPLSTFSAQPSLRLRKSQSRMLEINKKITVTLHLVYVQISSNIDIKLACCCNDSELQSSAIRRVDQKTRIANFGD